MGESYKADELDNYLHFSFENGNTVISVSSAGTFSDHDVSGTIVSEADDQKIALGGFDLTVENTLSDVQMIQTLLSGNHLITD